MSDSSCPRAKPLPRAGERGKSAKPRRRVLTEARREQNRVAQQAYRERQRDLRKARRETLQRTPINPPLKARPSQGTGRETTYPIVGEGVPSQETPAKGALSGRRPSSEEESGLPGTARPSPPANVSESSMLSSTAENASSNPPNHEASCDSTLLDPVLAVSPPFSTASLERAGKALAQFFENEGALLPSKNDATLDALMYDEDSSSTALTRRVPDQQIAALPDSPPQTIQLISTTIFSAVLENALCLGFDINEIASCGINSISPFYRPDITPQSDPASLLLSQTSSLTRNTQNHQNSVSRKIPIHLRPTLFQILIPHPASLDLVPIPMLRDRAIMLSAAMPHLFNIWELKIDIYARGGLRVWRGDRSGTRSRDGSGYQPWDMASWEAAPWFLEKWCMVVGGKDSELYQQSARWQALQGVNYA